MESIVLQRRQTACPNGGALAALAELCDDKEDGIPTAKSSRRRTDSRLAIAASLSKHKPYSSNVVATSATLLENAAFHQQNMIREIMLASLSLAKLSESPPVLLKEDTLPMAVSTSSSASSSSSVSSSISSQPPFPLIPIELRVANLSAPRLNSSNRAKPSILPTIALAASASSPTGDRRKGDAFRFREYQVTTWSRRLQEVEAFVSQHDHCMIPSDYPPNQKLAKWSKRQRCQYQLYQSNPSKSSMTIERIRVLEDLGFCWQNKMSVWQSRYQELLQFHLQFGHTQVPSSYKRNQRLATWVKCQRRQKRLRDRGKASSMTDDRITLLNLVNFVWRMYPSNPRDTDIL